MSQLRHRALPDTRSGLKNSNSSSNNNSHSSHNSSSRINVSVHQCVGNSVDSQKSNVLASLEEICRSTQDAGPCQDYSEQFYYDQYTHTCVAFTYGGCGGNLNRFRSADECQKRCGFLNPDQRQAQQQRPEALQQRPDAQQPQRPDAQQPPRPDAQGTVYIPPAQPQEAFYPQTPAPAIIPCESLSTKHIAFLSFILSPILFPFVVFIRVNTSVCMNPFFSRKVS